LIELYAKQKLTMQEIAQIKDCAYSTINKYINKYKIRTRKPGFKKGHKFSSDHRRKISESKRGSNHPNFGKKSRSKKRYWVKCPDGTTVSMRSRWEVAFAYFLTDQGITWEYEPETFVLPNGSAYTPDFWIEKNHYVEIKGWLTEESQRKISLFKEHYPGTLVVLQRKELKALGIDLNKDYPGLPAPKHQCEQCHEMFVRKEKRQRFCNNKCKNQWIANNKSSDKMCFQQAKRKYHGNQCGSQNNATKLTEEDVRDIIRLRTEGMLLSNIAKIKGTTVGNAGNIIKGRSWKHVSREI